MLSAEIVKETGGLDVPPPGAGAKTVTDADPAVERSVARIGALS
jgi:hypothetical protein